MSDYIITVNSTVDTTREWLTERGVPYIPLKYTIDGQTYSDMERSCLQRKISLTN